MFAEVLYSYVAHSDQYNIDICVCVYIDTTFVIKILFFSLPVVIAKRLSTVFVFFIIIKERGVPENRGAHTWTYIFFHFCVEKQ